jgi:ABC-2 type transporter
MTETIIIEPGRLERNYWLDLWRYRELFRVLAWRDLAVRYKQTVIGVAWSVIRPLLTVLVFTVVFGRIAKLPSDGTVPYPLMVFAGMLPWTFFATGLSEASNSLINNANLISKVYFPRLIVPTATVVVAFVDFLISFAILLPLMAWYRYPPVANSGAAGICAARLCRQRRTGIVDHRAQCQISGFPLRYSIHRTVRIVCIAGRVQLERRARRVAAALLPQPDGRCH